jgi:hypothetical protein
VRKAGDKDSLLAPFLEEINSIAEHVGCNPLASKLRSYAITNMATNECEPFIECVADR